ncbi:C-type lectin domain family 4 member A-like isoform X1 [Dipodomys spectabilis]|uniref:C-type lectin domain family 4 member A-like isoform X1 n=1 Tax=Dipodomys spectabilis TaxID=105255 RepID=UPI001C5361E8|nr:C-type lectin domain family 4 member A-like isoform X1 [Dipodomys spectabilis]
MASEITYAEVRFNSHSRPPNPKADAPQAPKAKATAQPSSLGVSTLLFASLVTFFLLLAILFLVLFIIFFQKYSQLLKERHAATELTHTQLECIKSPASMGGKVWSCCPQKWKQFNSHCYFMSSDVNSWEKSKEMCSGLQAHLMVVNSKEEQSFIIQHLNDRFAYYLGLWDPNHENDWQWVDQTPYNLSATFWRRGEPSDPGEACVVINNPRLTGWGWNDIHCSSPQNSICEMEAIYL